jgi:hypothetical protein
MPCFALSRRCSQRARNTISLSGCLCTNTATAIWILLSMLRPHVHTAFYPAAACALRLRSVDRQPAGIDDEGLRVVLV